MSHALPIRQTDVGDPARTAPSLTRAAALPAAHQPWMQMRRRLRLAMADLRRVVLDRCDQHPERARLGDALDGAIADLDQLIAAFDGPLLALMAAAEAAVGDADRDALHDRLSRHLAQGRARFARDDLVALMDGNGFVELGVLATLEAALADVARRAGLPSSGPPCARADEGPPRRGLR